MAQITTADLAADLGTTPREVRKFLRSEQGKNATVGKGARWSIEKREVRALKSRFAKWEAAKAVEATETPDETDAPQDDAQDA